MPAFEFVLAGRYKLLAPLGEGGMAAVYRARDLRLNRDVAIKILHDDLTRDPEFLARFDREAQVVASLSHPNIVPVYDVGEERGTHFIVMEYVRGTTLKDAIERAGAMPPDRAVALLRPVLDALFHAHEHNLIHRDVKPQNILIAHEGTPRLADFGIARLVDGSTTRTAAILGSAQYLSPEQSRGEEATAQSDIYACGVVLYEMLSGHPPFDGPNALAIAHHHLHTPPSPLHLHGSAGVRVESAVMQALEKEPDARFQSVADFSSAIKVHIGALQETAFQPLGPAQDPISAPVIEPRPNPKERDAGLVVRRSTRKSYLLAAGLGAGALAAAYVATLPTWGSLPSHPPVPYWLLPLACFAVAMYSWVNARSWIYTLDRNVAAVQWGLVSHRRFGVPIRHITTIELKQSPIDRVLGVGTVELCARDQFGDERRLAMEDIPRPRQTYEELVRLLRQAAYHESAAENLAPHGQSH